jgi:archaemetzincin
MHVASCALALWFLVLATLSILPAPSAAAGTEVPGEAQGARSPDSLPIVAIQPLGGVDPALVDAVARRIEQTFAVDLVVLPVKPLPEVALYRPRMRFRGERVLEWLEVEKPEQASTILGLMSSDLSVTKGEVYDWGVMGVASPARSAGVVSSYRMGPYRASTRLVTQRACQVAVHEMAHSLGVAHCPMPRCIMNDAHGGIATVDRSSGEFCQDCRRELEGMLREE